MITQCARCHGGDATQCAYRRGGDSQKSRWEVLKELFDTELIFLVLAESHGFNYKSV